MKLAISVSGALALVTVLGLPSSAQTSGFGTEATYSTHSLMSPLTLDKTTYDPSCIISVGPVDQSKQWFYQILPYSCGGTYWGADAKSGALYTETAIGRINSAYVYGGATSVSASSTGGSLDPAVLTSESMGVLLRYFDTLTVTVPSPGTSAVLRFTNFVNSGRNKWSGQNNSLSTLGYDMVLGPANPNLLPASCPKGQVTSGVFSGYISDSSSWNGSINYVDVCVYSGEILKLSTEINTFAALNGAEWNTDIDWNNTVYVDPLTPGVALTIASGTHYGSPNFKAPASSSSCNGTFTGKFYGNLQVLPGQNCVLSGGGVTGSVTQTGGKLTLTNASVGGNLTISDGTFSIGPFATINGNLIVKGVPSDQVANKICSTNIKGYLSLQDSGADFSIGPASSLCAGNSIGTSLVALRNTGTVAIFDDNVGGTLTVQNDSASTKIINNQVGNALLLQSNTGTTLVSGNVVAHNLQCTSNSSISGSRNTAGAKTGQCAKF